VVVATLLVLIQFRLRLSWIIAAGMGVRPAH